MFPPRPDGSLTSLRGFLSFFSFTTLAFLTFFFLELSSSLSPPSSLLSLAEALLSYLIVRGGETEQEGQLGKGSQVDMETKGKQAKSKCSLKKNKVTYSSAMSSSSSPGLNDSSKEWNKTENQTSWTQHALLTLVKGRFLLTAFCIWFVTVVALLSDLALGLHPLQVGIVLVIVWVAVLIDITLHALKVNTVTVRNYTQNTAQPEESLSWLSSSQTKLILKS